MTNHQGDIFKVINQLSTTGMIAKSLPEEGGDFAIILKDTKQKLGEEDVYVGANLFTGTPWASRQPTMLGTFEAFVESGLTFATWVQLREGKLLDGPSFTIEINGMQLSGQTRDDLARLASSFAALVKSIDSEEEE